MDAHRQWGHVCMVLRYLHRGYGRSHEVKKRRVKGDEEQKHVNIDGRKISILLV